CWMLGHEFVRRFLQHVLPKGLHKVRHFGLWHPASARRSGPPSPRTRTHNRAGHRSRYEGYAKRTLERDLPATRKRYAHRLANVGGTDIQNAVRSDLQNDGGDDDAAIA